jgi:hypothetical protein
MQMKTVLIVFALFLMVFSLASCKVDVAEEDLVEDEEQDVDVVVVDDSSDEEESDAEEEVEEEAEEEAEEEEEVELDDGSSSEQVDITTSNGAVPQDTIDAICDAFGDGDQCYSHQGTEYIFSCGSSNRAVACPGSCDLGTGGVYCS